VTPEQKPHPFKAGKVSKAFGERGEHLDLSLGGSRRALVQRRPGQLPKWGMNDADRQEFQRTFLNGRTKPGKALRLAQRPTGCNR
jgi:hypothetical protein